MTTLKHEGDEIIRLFHGRPESTVCQFASYIEAEQYGNLFASAPDLYAALEALLKDYGNLLRAYSDELADDGIAEAPEDDSASVARAALAKARDMKGGE